MTVAQPVKYTRAILTFMIALTLFLVCLDAVIVSRQRRILLDDFNKQAQNEFTLIETFLTEPLLQEKFTFVEQFIQQWGKEKTEIVEVRAFSPQGLLLVEFKRPSTDKEMVTFRHAIHFRDKHLLDLEIVKDLFPVTSHISHFWHQLILQSLLTTVALGIVLWFILKRLALQPLETEITRRIEVEKSLQDAKDQLEVRVAERTVELSTAIEEIHKEMSQKELAEQELLREKEQLSVTLRSIGDGVITSDMDGNVVMLNKVAEQLTGWKQQDALGKAVSKVFNIINEETGKPVSSPVNKVLASGHIIGLANHTILVGKDGVQRNIADSGAPIRNQKSEIIGVVLVFRDVTEENWRAHELDKARKLESVGLLAGGIAHDFNNILSAILGNVNLALYYTKPDDKVHSLLQEAEKASLRAKGLTQQLLTFAKGGEPIKELAQIKDVVQDSARFVLRGSNVLGNFHCGDELWPVSIDLGQISQVIQNIIINAKQAMPQGGVVEVTCANVSHDDLGQGRGLRPQDYVKITIEDNGIGMERPLLAKIFDPYFTTKQKGSGLGLAVSHSIISKHGGSIMVTSELGVGTTFTIYLPAEKDKEFVPAPHKEVVAVVEGQCQGRIMVMDDEAMLRLITQEMLTILGYEVFLAQNGDEAISIYKENLENKAPIDVIIMDLTIPGGMGGQEAVKEIHKINPQAKVVVSSGYSKDPIMANFKDFGFLAAIVKPFQLQDLHETLLEIM